MSPSHPWELLESRREVSKKIAREAAGRPRGRALAISGQKGSKGLFLASGATGTGPNPKRAVKKAQKQVIRHQPLEAPDASQEL